MPPLTEAELDRRSESMFAHFGAGVDVCASDHLIIFTVGVWLDDWDTAVAMPTVWRCDN